MTPASPSQSPTTSRLRRRVALAGVAAVAALGVTAASASAAPAQSTKGHVTAGGIDVTFDAKRPANAPATSATGSFVAEGPPVAILGVPKSVGSIRLSGPITCLETHGEDVSFYYPFDDASTTGLLGKTGSGLLVSLRKSGASDYKMGFSPMLSAFVPIVGCDFGTAPLSVTSGGWQNGG